MISSLNGLMVHFTLYAQPLTSILFTGSRDSKWSLTESVEGNAAFSIILQKSIYVNVDFTMHNSFL